MTKRQRVLVRVTPTRVILAYSPEYPSVEWWASIPRSARVINLMILKYAKRRDWEMVEALHGDLAAHLEGGY